jgi:hypothetical protein
VFAVDGDGTAVACDDEMNSAVRIRTAPPGGGVALLLVDGGITEGFPKR